MFRKVVLCLALSAGILQAQEPELPGELQLRIQRLQLINIDIVFGQRAQCVGVVGINRNEKKVFYISMRYIGDGSTFHWTPFVEVPMDPRSDKFLIDAFVFDVKMVKVALHWNSKIGFASMSGYCIEFDPTRKIIFLRRISVAELTTLLGARAGTDEPLVESEISKDTL
jgi:hypothetical protein